MIRSLQECLHSTQGDELLDYDDDLLQEPELVLEQEEDLTEEEVWSRHQDTLQANKEKREKLRLKLE